MALSNISSATSATVAVCGDTSQSHNHGVAHNSGDGRECEYGVDSENYSTNTLEQSVTITGGS